jgi:hypothetical protein
MAMIRVVLLFVCVFLSLGTLPGHAQIDRVSPVELSKEQLANIHVGVRAELKTPQPSLRFGNIIGGRDGKGTLHVCGWITTEEGQMPFSGLFAERGFVVIRLGSGQRDMEATLFACKLRGLGL